MRSSFALKQIDLSCMYISGGIQVRIVQWANYTSNCGRACDISVRSIVEHEKCSLRQLQLPAKWCGYRNRSPELESILSDYNDMLQRRDFSCNGGEHESVVPNGFIDAYGVQKYTCHQCLENICNDPAFEIRVNQCVR